MASLKLSAVIIAYNEARNIARCIHSLQRVADEVVVVDSYSTDNTREIARSLGALVVENPFHGFTDQKNFAVQQVRYDLVLSLDADEYLSDALVEAIQQVRAGGNHADGYTFNRLNHFKGRPIKSCGWYPDAKIRLWDRRKGRWVGDLVHEVVALDKGAAHQHLPGDLMHDSYRSVSELLGKMQKYSDLYARQHAYRKKVTTFKIFYKTVAAFFKNYFLQRGVFDGYPGLVIAASNANNVFYKYAKLQELNRMASISLLVTSGSHADILKPLLTSIRQQSVLPLEVIIAANGQDHGAQTFIANSAPLYPVPLRYIDLKDGDSLRSAIQQAEGAYTIAIDARASLRREFIEGHQQKAIKGRFIPETSGAASVSFWKEDLVTTDSFNGAEAVGGSIPDLISSLQKAGVKPYKR